MRPDVQIYENYTEEDFLVWQTLMNRQMSILKDTVSKSFLQAIDVIGFKPSEIPDFKKVNQVLASTTGWEILTVPGLCPPNDFFQLLGNKKFTSTCWLRNFNQLDYIEEPDMFHDVFGHQPLLTNTDYCNFFQRLGALAAQHTGNQAIIDQIERLYWFTIEFGLIQEDGKLKIYGAGIISSKGETLHALGNESVKTPFDLEKILNHQFRNDVIQNEYFVIDSFNQLVEVLPRFESMLAEGVVTGV